MAWNLEGNYLENCSCDIICPCTWSGLTAKATHDRCKAVLAFHIDRGDIEGIEVSGLTFALVIDTPPVMSDGDWKVGVVLDAAADEAQAGALGRVVGGELGGPPGMLAPLIGEMVGIEQAAAEWRQSNGTFSVRFGDSIEIEVTEVKLPDFPEPVRLTNIFHPANSTLTVASATKSKIDMFGISFNGLGTSGFHAPFAWSA